MNSSNKNQIYRILLSIFIAFHLCVLAAWSFANCTLTEALLSPIKNICLFAGLWQNFAMFSPDPRVINLNFMAVITYADGSVKLWPFPRMEQLNYWDRMVKERYRKYVHDHISRDEEKMLWADAARHVAYINNNDKQNPPALVSLVSFISPVLDIDSKNLAKTTSRTFFTYKVQPEDLK